MNTYRQPQSTRRIAVAGVAFVATFLAGGLLLGGLFGGFADSDAFFVDYYSSNSHHPRDLAGGYLLAASGFLMLVFLHDVIALLRTHGASDSELSLASSGGTIGVALLLAGVGAILTVTFAKAFGRIFDDKPLTSTAVALAPQAAYVLIFLTAMWGIAFSIGMIVWADWRARNLPAWLRALSLTSAVLLLLAALTFMSIAMLPVWVLGVSVWAWRIADPVQAYAPTPATAETQRD